MAQWSPFMRRELIYARPYEPGESLAEIHIGDEARKAGSPKPGDMIGRKNPNVTGPQNLMWLIDAQDFGANYEAGSEADFKVDPAP
jgi:hypothetical protein